jgi:hypothetical protein
MKQLSILAFEAPPHEGVPSSKWHNQPAYPLSPRQELAASLRGVLVDWYRLIRPKLVGRSPNSPDSNVGFYPLGSDLADELGHECPVYVESSHANCPFGPDPNRLGRQVGGVGTERTLLRMLAAATAAAALSASGFTITAAAQSDQQPTHAEVVQRWAEAALDAQLKGMNNAEGKITGVSLMSMAGD